MKEYIKVDKEELRKLYKLVKRLKTHNNKLQMAIYSVRRQQKNNEKLLEAAKNK